MNDDEHICPSEKIPDNVDINFYEDSCDLLLKRGDKEYWSSIEIHFCPFCGKPLSKDAKSEFSEMKKRLEDYKEYFTPRFVLPQNFFEDD